MVLWITFLQITAFTNSFINSHDLGSFHEFTWTHALKDLKEFEARHGRSNIASVRCRSEMCTMISNHMTTQAILEYEVELAECVLTKHEAIIHVPELRPFVRSTLRTLPHLLDDGSKLGKWDKWGKWGK